MEYVIFNGVNEAAYNDACYVRYMVFSQEQKYDPAIDIDETDKVAWHVVCYEHDVAIGTARLYLNHTKGYYKIGRVAVLSSHRHQQIGQEMVQRLIDKAKYLGIFRSIVLNAQSYITPFYQKMGFEIIGEEFLEEGQPHISMSLDLKIRGFEVAKGFADAAVSLPVRKTHTSAGHDLALIEEVTIPPHANLLVKTGLKAYMLDDEVLEIYVRSSIALKQNIWLANNVGIIDADYYENPDNDGHIMIPLYNANETAVTLKQGERVAQGIFKKYLTIDGENKANFIERSGGFGSTGK